MIHTVRDRIPRHVYIGKSADFWSDILEHLISNIMKKTGCSRSDLIFKFNYGAYREIYYKFMTACPCYDIKTVRNPRDLMTTGTVLGVDFEVIDHSIIDDLAVITLETKKKHWMDDYFNYDSFMKRSEAIKPMMVKKFPEIKKVIFSDPATIVFWEDGTKTVVKCMKGETFDPEKGILVAWYKKLYGNKPNYMKDIKKWAESYNQIVPNDSFFNFDSKYVKGEE